MCLSDCATDLALRATKSTAQAIGRSVASLVVLERHLWLTLTEIKDADKVSFLDAPISPSGLFGPAVEGFAERFTEGVTGYATLPAQALQLNSCSESPQDSAAREACTCRFRPSACQDSADARAFMLSQTPPLSEAPGPPTQDSIGPCASGVLLICRTGRGEGRDPRPATAGPPTSLRKPLFTPFFSRCRGNCVCCKYRARTSAHVTIRCDSGKNKMPKFSKREQFSSSVPHECPASVQPATRVYPTPCHAGRGPRPGRPSPECQIGLWG